MVSSKFLAFDFGAESGRAIIGILKSGKISIEEIHRSQNKQIKILDHLHWDILSLIEEIKKSIKLAVQRGHTDIQSIGLNTWGVDFGFIREYENNGRNFEKLALLEESKSMRFSDVWDYYCYINNVPVGHLYIPEIQEYEKEVLAKR